MTSATASKPAPVPDALSKGFWESTQAGQLAIQHCEYCGRLSHPPVPLCGACVTVPPAFDFAPVSGRGRVRTWTVLRQAFLPGFADDVPYTIVVVELEEQTDLMIMGQLVDGPHAELSIGARVVVVLEPNDSGYVVPAFALEAPR